VAGDRTGTSTAGGTMLRDRLPEPMSDIPTPTSTFCKESSGHCDCCGRVSKTMWGDLSDATGALAVWFVQWTVDAAEHRPNIDLVVGRWGEGADPADRDLVALGYAPSGEGGSFMVIDGAGRPADKRDLCGRALRRDQVIGTPLAAQVFALVDALWLTEPRIAEVRALDDLA
jgi:hypothetical protein